MLKWDMFLLGIMGAIGFEGLQIYRNIWRGHLPFTKHIFYLVIRFTIILCSGLLTVLVSPSNYINALIVGFTLPLFLKEISIQKDIYSEDVSSLSSIAPNSAIINILRNQRQRMAPIDFIAMRVGKLSSEIIENLKILEKKGIIKIEGDNVILTDNN